MACLGAKTALRFLVSQTSLHNQAQTTPGLVSGNAKKQPATGGAYAQSFVPPVRGNSKTRGQQQLAVASGKAALPLHSSHPGGGAFNDDLRRYESSREVHRSAGGPPGLTPQQRDPNTFKSFACACDNAFVSY